MSLATQNFTASHRCHSLLQCHTHSVRSHTLSHVHSIITHTWKLHSQKLHTLRKHMSRSRNHAPSFTHTHKPHTQIHTNLEVAHAHSCMLASTLIHHTSGLAHTWESQSGYHTPGFQLHSDARPSAAAHPFGLTHAVITELTWKPLTLPLAHWRVMPTPW